MWVTASEAHLSCIFLPFKICFKKAIFWYGKLEEWGSVLKEIENQLKIISLTHTTLKDWRKWLSIMDIKKLHLYVIR